jgi:hypothetical protein
MQCMTDIKVSISQSLAVVNGAYDCESDRTERRREKLASILMSLLSTSVQIVSRTVKDYKYDTSSLSTQSKSDTRKSKRHTV